MELPKILINSVPKSGTNLLVQIIGGIPGMFQDQHEFYHTGNRDKIFHLKNGEFVTSHINYNESFSKDVSENKIKHVFIYRDLRDVTVSMRHFILGKLTHHPLHSIFKTRITNKEEQIEALINGTQFKGEELNNNDALSAYPGLYHEYQMIYKWVYDPTICAVRYEDFIISKQTREKALYKIINYLWDDLSHMGMTKKELLSIMENNINPEKAWTFRKGEIGNWKEEFSENNKKSFKKVSGNFLIEFGYEANLDW